MSDKHLGACLCGAINFETDGTFDHFYLCHCGHCRKDSGSAHTANIFSSSAKLVWLSGQDKLTTYTLPGTRHTRSFCSICGSAMPYTLGSMLVVPAGALTTSIGIVPDAHIFVASKASWERNLSDAPSFDGFPA